jgi:hypothetical protein
VRLLLDQVQVPRRPALIVIVAATTNEVGRAGSATKLGRFASAGAFSQFREQQADLDRSHS